MSVSLYILQHGHAVSKQEDPQRPLSGDGERDIVRLARHLAAHGVSITQLYHSGKHRAEQTANIVAHYLEAASAPVVLPGISPNDDPAAFAGNFEWSEGGVLLASHMPFVSRLCSQLLTTSPETVFEFTPGTLARLDFDMEQWALAWMLRPDVY